MLFLFFIIMFLKLIIIILLLYLFIFLGGGWDKCCLLEVSTHLNYNWSKIDSYKILYFKFQYYICNSFECIIKM